MLRDDSAPPSLQYAWPGTYYMGAEEERAVMDVLRSRSLFRYYGHDLQGYADRLEALYCSRTGQPHGLAVSSCTVALYAAFAGLGLGPGDEVLVPGYMWISCVGAIVRAGCIPRLVEVDESFTIDPTDMERKCGPRTRAVLVVHMSGAPADMEPILEIARREGLFVVEDLAQSNGASYRGKPVGSFGDVAVTSFQYNKNATSGEGGLLLCRDAEVYRRAFALHDLGFARNDKGILDTAAGEVCLWGVGGRMSEVTAALAWAQTTKLDAAVARMNHATTRIYDGLAEVRGLKTRRRVDAAGDSGSFVLLTWPDADIARAAVMRTRELGVDAGPKGPGNVPMEDFGLHLYYNLTNLGTRVGSDPSGHPWTHAANAFASGYDYRRGALPVSDDLFARSSILGITPAMTDRDCDCLVEAFRTAAAELVTQ